jgi:hypothetical protein
VLVAVVIAVADEKAAICPASGDPLVVTVPLAAAAHFTPSVSVESAVSTKPFAPTGMRALTVEKPKRSPLVVSGEVTFARTNAVVASFVELSPTICVVAVVPFGRAGVPLRFEAVPVVFWFHVGTVPVRPVYGTEVAVIVPVPETARLAPVPIVIAAVVFVLVVRPLKAIEVPWTVQEPPSVHV